MRKSTPLVTRYANICLLDIFFATILIKSTSLPSHFNAIASFKPAPPIPELIISGTLSNCLKGKGSSSTFTIDSNCTNPATINLLIPSPNLSINSVTQFFLFLYCFLKLSSYFVNFFIISCSLIMACSFRTAHTLVLSVILCCLCIPLYFLLSYQLHCHK